MTLISSQIAGVARTLLAFAAGGLASAGLIAPEQATEAVDLLSTGLGALGALGVLVWSWVEKAKAARGGLKP
jgi:hypothetical protein